MQIVLQINMGSVTTNLYLDKRRPLSNGNFPVKLRVTSNRKTRLFKLTDKNRNAVNVNQIEFDKITNQKRLTKELLELKASLDNQLVRARNTVDKISLQNPPFTFSKFEIEFVSNINDQSVFGIYNLIIQEFEARKSFSTANQYKDSLNSLKRYAKRQLSFNDIDIKFLKGFEDYLMHEAPISVKNKDSYRKGKSPATISMYLRALRSVYNRAITLGIADNNSYPFGKNQFKIKSGSANKRALTKEDIRKIHGYKPLEHTPEWYAKNYFLLSYLCNGINFIDLLELTPNDYDGEFLAFTRRKTRTTTKEVKKIIVPVSPLAKSIIEVLRSRKGHLLFPILEGLHLEEQKRKRKNQFLKTTNKYLSKIAKELELSVPKITTYHARHSWTSIQLKNKVGLDVISQGLGHTNMKTTENYIAEINKDELRGLNDNLI